MKSSLCGKLLATAIGVICLGGVNSAGAAFPDRTVHMVVGYAPGGGADLVARLVATKLAEKWNQAVVVDNKLGATGAIAADLVAHAAPDGYTISLVTVALTTMNLPLGDSNGQVNFDPTTSFTPITLVASQPDVLLLNPMVPAKNIAELIALAKAKPGSLNFASAGAGGPTSLEMALLMKAAGINMVEIAYKGDAVGTTALLSGEVQLAFAGINVAVPQIKSGQLRPVAIMGIGAGRSTLLPDIPALSEALNDPNLEGGTWEGIVGPAGIPADILAKLHDDIVAIAKTPDFDQQLTGRGFIMIASTPAALGDRIRKDNAKWRDFLKTNPAK